MGYFNRPDPEMDYNVAQHFLVVRESQFLPASVLPMSNSKFFFWQSRQTIGSMSCQENKFKLPCCNWVPLSDAGHPRLSYTRSHCFAFETT